MIKWEWHLLDTFYSYFKTRIRTLEPGDLIGLEEQLKYLLKEIEKEHEKYE